MKRSRCLDNLLPVVFMAFALLCGATLLATGCASRPDVRTEQDPTAELTHYKTFAFREPAASDQAQYTDLLAARLKHATRAQLERAQYVYSERDTDLHVNLRLVVSEKVVKALVARQNAYPRRERGLPSFELSHLHWRL
jgi:type IV pilus biogenesis protein CpaD/CtpE